MHRKYHLLCKQQTTEANFIKYALMNINVLVPSFFLFFLARLLLPTSQCCERFNRISFSEILMQRFYKPWLLLDFIFRKSSYAAKYESSLNILHNFTMKVRQIWLCLLSALHIPPDIRRESLTQLFAESFVGNEKVASGDLWKFYWSNSSVR